MKSDEQLAYFGRDLEAMSFVVNYHNWIIDEFKPYFGASVAEVGAGTGNFTKLLISSNANIKCLVAFEPSSNMYPLLEESLAGVKQIKTINCFFSDKYDKSEKGFDSVMYINVLEHTEGDEKELSYVYQSLKSGGHALVFVPALSWLYGDLDKKLGHYRRYHKRELITLVKSAGFNIVRVKYLDFAGIIPWYVAFVLLKRSITGSNVSLYDKLVIPLMRRIERIITPPIGKNLLLVGKKA
jgi:SAM-dependent methyltransferase